MTYSAKEIFYTLQGEGINTGRPAVFCRFAGCNLWSGLVQDRQAAICSFCDTDFVGTDGIGGGKFKAAEALADAINRRWPSDHLSNRLVVCTGGEPLLQLDEPLIKALHCLGFEVAVETNGTLAAPPGIDWICVSPKSTSELVIKAGDEMKLVYPQQDALPEKFKSHNFTYFYCSQWMDRTVSKIRGSLSSIAKLIQSGASESNCTKWLELLELQSFNIRAN